MATAALGLTLLICPTAALAQGGNGLYEPFPKAAVEKRAKRFVQRLDSPVRFSERDLDEGTFVDPGAIGIERGLAPAATAGAASERAGTADEGSSVPLRAAAPARRPLRHLASPDRRTPADKTCRPRLGAPWRVPSRSPSASACSRSGAPARTARPSGQASAAAVPPGLPRARRRGRVRPPRPLPAPRARRNRSRGRRPDPPDVRLGDDRAPSRPLRLPLPRRLRERSRAAGHPRPADPVQPAPLPLEPAPGRRPARRLPAEGLRGARRLRRAPRAPLRTGRELLAPAPGPAAAALPCLAGLERAEHPLLLAGRTLGERVHPPSAGHRRPHPGGGSGGRDRDGGTAEHQPQDGCAAAALPERHVPGGCGAGLRHARRQRLRAAPPPGSSPTSGWRSGSPPHTATGRRCA